MSDMTPIRDVLARDPAAIVTPPRVEVTSTYVSLFDQAGNVALNVTREELGAVGAREFTGDDGIRRVVLGLCRDEHGEWIYPPPRQAGESMEQTVERNAKTRWLLKNRCATQRTTDRTW